MWICSRCHTENRDSAAACEGCGAVRAAGRFGSAPARGENAVRAPLVRAPANAAMPAAEPPRPAPYRPPEAEAFPAPPRRRIAGLARGAGAALCVLLPLLTVLLAWRQYDAAAGALIALFWGEGATEAGKLLCYIGLALIAVLLSLLPGLWTLLLAGPRHPKNRE